MAEYNYVHIMYVICMCITELSIFLLDMDFNEVR
jgi:hypothetical protein